MNTQKENKNLEEKVDEIIKKENKILSLKAKLKSIENQRKEANSEIMNNDLQRYKTIVEYFVKNKDRAENNRKYLVEVMYGLTRCISPVMYNDSKSEENDSNFILIKILSNEIKSMLNLEVKYGGTGTGVGVSI